MEGFPRPPAEAENSPPLFPEGTFSFTSPVETRKSPEDSALFLWQYAKYWKTIYHLLCLQTTQCLVTSHTFSRFRI